MSGWEGIAKRYLDPQHSIARAARDSEELLKISVDLHFSNTSPHFLGYQEANQVIVIRFDSAGVCTMP